MPMDLNHDPIDLGEAPTKPQEGECLVCFLSRAVAAEGCDHTLGLAGRYRDQQVPGATGLEARLRGIGCACCCAVLRRGWWLERRWWERDLDTDELRPPRSPPGCAIVASTSARPCRLWVRPGRWDRAGAASPA